MIDTLIGLGMFGVLIYIATKVGIVNDVSHEIRDILIDLTLERGKSPPIS